MRRVRGFLHKAAERCKNNDSLAEDTVVIAPVSGPNSLLTGNLTGNFSNLGLFLRFSLLIDEQIQSLAE
jgi:hypothetical protein